jgi:uncharacterized protein YkwD
VAGTAWIILLLSIPPPKIQNNMVSISLIYLSVLGYNLVEMEGCLMVRFLTLVLFIFLINASWPTIKEQLADSDVEKTIENIQSEIDTLQNNPEVQSTFQSLNVKFQQILSQLNNQLDELPLSEQKIETPEREKIELKPPMDQPFSISNAKLGQSREEIEGHLGEAKRSTFNEYGTNWYTYHDDYHNFLMVMYDGNNKAIGLYTNQDLISSTKGIKKGSSKEVVRVKLGEPLTKIHKGFTILKLQEDNDYDLFQLDGMYVTIFYDKHRKNTVTAMQLISKELEQKKTDIYTEASATLKEGFEYQLFDLTNATRVNHQLPILSWDQHVRETARKHSIDMAVNDYFNHTNLDGKSPFDRLKEDDVTFHLAGENLAYGQFSSIFAHEGLMNSLGHRENILQKDFEFLGVGVAFNEKSQPYYTQNFYAK